MEKLAKRISELKNPTVAGLDTRIEYLPENFVREVLPNGIHSFEDAAKAVYAYNVRLIDALCDIVPAVKVQVAYYEMYGIEGIKCLKKTIDYARKKDMYVILDAKRGDIGATSEAYATAYLGKTKLGQNETEAFGADCMTVNPYLGTDGVFPFVKQCGQNKKGIFVLVKTSNKSSGEIQDLKAGGRYIYEHIAELVMKWGSDVVGTHGYSSVGAVVGATYPEQAEQLRRLMPRTYFLVPGYGAQGGGAEDVKPCFNEDGLGAIVNASRSIMCAYKKNGGTVGEAARAEAIRMRDDILSVLE